MTNFPACMVALIGIGGLALSCKRSTLAVENDPAQTAEGIKGSPKEISLDLKSLNPEELIATPSNAAGFRDGFTNWYREDPKAALNFALQIEDPASREWAVTLGEDHYLLLSDELVEAILEGKLRDQSRNPTISRLMSNLGARDPQKGLDLLLEKFPQGRPKAIATSAFFSGYFQADSVASLKLISSLPYPEDREEAVDGITSAIIWSKQDIKPSLLLEVNQFDRKVVKQIADSLRERYRRNDRLAEYESFLKAHPEIQQKIQPKKPAESKSIAR